MWWYRSSVGATLHTVPRERTECTRVLQALQSVSDLEGLANACYERFGGVGLGLTAVDEVEWEDPDHVLVTPR